MPITTREFGPDDSPQMAEMHAKSFDRPWKAWEIRRVLASSGNFAFGAFDIDGAFAGFIAARRLVDEAEILTLAVDPGARQRGVGRALTRAAAAKAATLGAQRLILEVAADNPAAIALYEGFGFSTVGRRKGYYQRAGQDRVDALVMALPLESA